MASNVGDTGLFRLAVSENVWAFTKEDHDLGYLLDCLLLACLLHDMRFDHSLGTWLNDCSQISASVVSFSILRPRPFDN